ncbi:MAG: glycosyltransferase family 2 protein [Oscillospiraceae bacterium]|nr:glycosyltransferase family 2 protein [Oscillospiraceae bacterium]
MTEDKVSVIVPVYNAEPYLRRCLESILGQSYRNLEVILVDDGSTDNCGRICREYAETDPRFRVIHKENGGVSSARNAAIRNATGKYIVFVDSDDSILPDYVRNLMDAGEEDYVAAGCCVQSEDGLWAAWETAPCRITLDQLRSAPEMIHAIPTGIVCAKRYKREILERERILFRCDISRGEDTLFNCVYLKACNTIAVVKALDYRYHFNQASATSLLNTNLFRWSMESVLTMGEIIGRDNRVFHERVWGNAMTVCDNYFRTAGKGSWRSKRQMIRGILQVCADPFVRRSLAYAKRGEEKKKAILVQFYLYPFLPFLYSVCTRIRSLFGRG